MTIRPHQLGITNTRNHHYGLNTAFSWYTVLNLFPWGTTLISRYVASVYHHPTPLNDPPWVLPFCSGTLRNHISDVTKKNWDSLPSPVIFQNSNSEISNISEITSCGIMIWGSKPIFSCSRNQINTLYSMADHYHVCKRTKTLNKSKMAANFTLYFGKCVITSVLVAIKMWFWCLNLSFHVWKFQ